MSSPTEPRGSNFTKSFLARDERLRALLLRSADADLHVSDHRVMMLLLVDGPLRRYDKIEATYTRVQIAARLEMSKEQVSRSLARLEKAGLISKRSIPGPRGKVVIRVILPEQGDPSVRSSYPFQAWNKDAEQGPADGGMDVTDSTVEGSRDGGMDVTNGGSEGSSIDTAKIGDGGIHVTDSDPISDPHATNSPRIGGIHVTTYQERETYSGESRAQESVSGHLPQPPSSLHLHQVPSSSGRGFARDEGRPLSSERMLEVLIESLSADGNQRLNSTRQREVLKGLTSLRLMDPTLSDREVLYLLGFWAGDRLLANANHLPENAMRHRQEASALLDELVEQSELTCVTWGFTHGSEHREARTAR